ncbi:MAG: branched-chain amino acid ABC transporter permease, partial [Bradyrhizobium sp.]|nr:branched-chain amino acid ABC transporter permease [Bradyrhizobium sp.]
MSLTQSAPHIHAEPAASAAQRPAAIKAWAEFDNPAAWLVAVILLIMPLIANKFFLIEIFGTTLILGTVALSLMFLAG